MFDATHLIKHTTLMQPISFKNQFIISMPALTDPNFNRAVIFLCEHNEEGAMGLMINKPLNVQLGGVLEHLEIDAGNNDISAIENIPIYMGGPVGQEHGFVIHEPYREDEGADDLVISASRDTLTDIAKGAGPSQYLVALGYTGWGGGQLEEEINGNDWLVAPYDKDIIFKTPTDSRWQRAIELLGIDINQLSSQVGHA